MTLPSWVHFNAFRNRRSYAYSPVWEAERYWRIVRGYRRLLKTVRRGSLRHHEIRLLLRRAVPRPPGGHVAAWSETVRSSRREMDEVFKKLELEERALQPQVGEIVDIVVDHLGILHAWAFKVTRVVNDRAFVECIPQERNGRMEVIIMGEVPFRMLRGATRRK